MRVSFETEHRTAIGYRALRPKAVMVALAVWSLCPVYHGLCKHAYGCILRA